MAEDDMAEIEQKGWVNLSEHSWVSPAKRYSLEDQLYEELLEYATTTRSSPSAILITGPAGYGMSTLLMVLALKVLTEKAGLAFMLNPSQSIIQGDVEYTISLFPDKKIFFFVDNAADNVEGLIDSLQRLREKKQSALFIICER